MANKAIRYMALRERILREKRYIRSLETKGKPASHRKEILKKLESELAHE